MPAPTDPRATSSSACSRCGMVSSTQSRLVLAFQSWRLNRTSLAEILVDQRGARPRPAPDVDALAAQVLKTHVGDVGRSLTALPAGLDDDVGAAPVETPSWTRASRGSAPRRRRPETTQPHATHFVDVGRATVGGTVTDSSACMQGAVQARVQCSSWTANCTEAKKEILPNHADDPASRQRFLVEAEITGGSNTRASSRCTAWARTRTAGCDAMRLIKEDFRLKDAIGVIIPLVPPRGPPRSWARRPCRSGWPSAAAAATTTAARELELRQLLRRFLDVCNAIHYAHRRGVLHRDIKPGNIIAGMAKPWWLISLAGARGRVEA
ncbi:MAG: hypothetical protein U0835_01565 [Isosphaeraceae bacterium]